MKKQIIIIIFLGMFLLSFVSAQVGIYEPVAEPDIYSCQDINLEYRNKREGTVNYNLKIKPGTGEQGSFNVYADCSGCATGRTTADTHTIVGSEVKSGNIKVTQNSNTDGTGSCQLKASIQRLGFSAQDTCDIQITCKKSCAIQTEACSTDSDCCEGLGCYDGSCSNIPGVEICDNGLDDDQNGFTDCLDKKCKTNTNCGGSGVNTKNYNSSSNVFIIAFAIIIGLIILGIILKKRK